MESFPVTWLMCCCSIKHPAGSLTELRERSRRFRGSGLAYNYVQGFGGDMRKVMRLAAIFVMAAGIVSSDAQGFRRSAPGMPPPRQREVVPRSPGPQFVWAQGYWAWDGRGWVWVPGAWLFPPKPRAAWVPGRWERNRRGRGCQWVRGRWR